jgi:hypothetical protein
MNIIQKINEKKYSNILLKLIPLIDTPKVEFSLTRCFNTMCVILYILYKRKSVDIIKDCTFKSLLNTIINDKYDIEDSIEHLVKKIKLNKISSPIVCSIFNVKQEDHCFKIGNDIGHCFVIYKIEKKYILLQSYINKYTLEDYIKLGIKFTPDEICNLLYYLSYITTLKKWNKKCIKHWNYYFKCNTEKYYKSDLNIKILLKEI